MVSVTFSLFVTLFLVTIRGVSCEDLSPVQTEDFSSQGTTVTLSYTYSKLSSGDRFFWYRQYPGKPPEFLISHFDSGELMSDPTPRLKIKVEQKQINMTIISAAVTDSAVYYCALQPLDGYQKILFGSGTSLTIEPREEYEPSKYLLKNGNESACLATGISRANNSLTGGLDWPKPTRISEDSLYNSVVLLEDKWQEGECSNATDALPCVDILEKDPTVNTVSVVVLGLRVLFIKTVIFNVLMTLRLWISQ